MPEPFQHDVFISYSSQDRQLVVLIAEHLRNAGLKVWLDVWATLPGIDIRQKVVTALGDSRRVLFCISQASLRSEWSALEKSIVLFKDPNNRQRRLIPLLLERCELPDELAHLEFIDGCVITPAVLEEIERHCAVDAGPPAPSGHPAGESAVPHVLPEIHNISFRRNPNFRGRSDLLGQIHDRLADQTRVAVSQVIHGLGGLGKTQVALEYVYRYGHAYRLAWWVRAQFPVTAQEDYQELALKLGLTQRKSREPLTAVNLVRDWLDRHDGWLLVFDNAEGPSSVNNLLPRIEAGHILITSRNPHWHAFTSLEITFWEHEESIAFLLHRVEQADPSTADALATLLGDFPLALEQAAAFILEAGISVKAYIDLFHKHPCKMLGAGRAPEDYEHTVATTWNLAFQRIRTSAAASDLLELIARAEPDMLTQSLFLNRLDSLSEPLHSELAFHDAIRLIRTYSLITVSDDTIVMHRLVRQVTTERSEDQASRYMDILAKLYQRQKSIAYLRSHTSLADLQGAREAAGLLNDLEVALTGAAAYIVQANLPLGDFSQAFRMRRDELRAAAGAGKGDSAAGPVATVTSLAVERIRRSRQHADLLAFIADQESYPILPKVFQPPFAGLPIDLRSESVVNAALSELRSYALIQVADGAVSVPAPVRAYIKTQQLRSLSFHFRLRDVRWKFRQEESISLVDLEVPYHRVTGLIGPADNGRSSLLKIIFSDGRPIKDLTVTGSIEYHAAAGRRIARVTSQLFTVNETVRDSFKHWLRITRSVLGIPGKREQLDWIERSLRQAALWEDVKARLNTSVLLLPDAQRHLLSLAHALCTQPDILLIDGLRLDPYHLAQIEESLASLKDTCTILYASDDQYSVARVADYTGFMMAGRLIEFDKTDVIYKRPAKKETEDFITGRYQT